MRRRVRCAAACRSSRAGVLSSARFLTRGLGLAAVVTGFVLLAPTGRSATPGLVAAFSFDEGSGTTVTDASGTGNNGTTANTTWVAAGRYGKALTFNGTSSRVNVPDATALHLSTGMTLEAWVNPTTVSNSWRDVIYKGNDNYFLEATSTGGSAPAGGGIFGNGSATTTVKAPTALTRSTWSHIALTYDGATLRLFVNGTQVATQARTGAIRTSTNPLQIGSDSIFGQYFSGSIDEVRVYNRALTAAEVQSDMNTPLGGTADNQPPSAPGTLTATAASATQDQPQLGSSHRQRRRHRLPHRALHRSRLHQLRADRRTARHRNDLQRHRPHQQHDLHLSRARHRRGREPRPLLQHRPRDHAGDSRQASRHRRPGTLTRYGRSAASRGRPQLGSGDRQRRRHRLPHRALPGSRLHQLRPDRRTARHRDDLQRHRPHQPTRPTAIASARPMRPATSAPTPTPRRQSRRAPQRPALVAAYSFDEGSGSTVADASGDGNSGSLVGATWAVAGKFGKALCFNGSSARVTSRAPRRCSSSSGMTLEAWVRPAAVVELLGAT